MSSQTADGRRSSLDGLLALKGQAAAVERVIELPVAAIHPNPDQPRKDFPQDSIEALARTIAADGLAQPILVRPMPVSATVAPDGQDQYELVAGERRLRAHQHLGRPTIKAIVRNMEEAKRFKLAIIENVQREDLSLLDRAMSFQKYAEQLHNGKVEPAAEDLQISRRTGFYYVKIARSPKVYLDAIGKHRLDVRAADLLLSLDGKAQEVPGAVEALHKLIAGEALDIDALRSFHAKFFPSAETAEPAEAAATVKKKAAGKAPTEDKDDAPFWKTDKEVGLELRFKTDGEIQERDRRAWTKAAERFFKAAGAKKVDIRF